MKFASRVRSKKLENGGA